MRQLSLNQVWQTMNFHGFTKQEFCEKCKSIFNTHKSNGGKETKLGGQKTVAI